MFRKYIKSIYSEQYFRQFSAKNINLRKSYNRPRGPTMIDRNPTVPSWVRILKIFPRRKNVNVTENINDSRNFPKTTKTNYSDFEELYLGTSTADSKDS